MIKQTLSNKSFETLSIKGRIHLLQNYWLKPLKTKLPYSQIATNLIPIEYRDEDIICRSNQKVSTYYLLVQGTVNAYQTKQGLTLGEYFCQIRQPQFIGESIYSFNTYRSCTWKAVGFVKCFKISADILLELTMESVNEYNTILLRLAQNLDVDFSYLSRYELYKKMKYRECIKNVKVTEYNQKSGNRSLFLILEGECKFCLKSEYIKSEKPNQQLLPYQQHVLNLCSNEIIGVQPHFQNQYKYDYIVNTATCELIQLSLKDIRDNFFQFPTELYEKMRQVYIQHKRIVEKALYKITEVQNISLDQSQTKSCCYNNPKIKKFLQDACMYIPNISNHVSKREYKAPQPTSAFIPLKKKQQKIVPQMKRRDWRSYIKLPVINKLID